MWFDPLAWTSDGLNSGPRIIFTSQQLLFIAVSLFANLIIITYHLTNPPHPKFSFSLQSRLCIRTHVFSGVIGVVLPFTHEQAATICMWVYSFIDFIFAISVAMQAPNVYGVRRLTVSMYFTAVFFKFPSQLPPPSWVVEEDSPLLEDNDCILHPNGEDMGNPASGSGCTNGVKAAGGAKIAPTEYDAAAC
eukprot:gene1035-747_t